MLDQVTSATIALRTEPIFVVGCSRGGTTLLQSILNQHPSLVSFPETNILYAILDDLDYRRYGRLMGCHRIPVYLLKRLVNRLGYTLSYSPRKFRNFLRALGREDLLALVPQKTIAIADVFAAFQTILDSISAGQRYIEKTPQNIFCIDFIETRIPQAQFVHIVRDGKETVASLHAAAQKYESFRARFGGPQGLLKAIHYWNSTLRISYRHRHHPRHAIVRYEDVAADPAKALARTAAFLGIELTADMFQYNTAGIIFDFEAHKKDYAAMIAPRPGKFDTVFTPQQRKLITARILPADDYFPRQI